MRQGATLMPDDDPEAKKALARWMVAFARALRIHFQPEVRALERLLSYCWGCMRGRAGLGGWMP